MFEVVREELLDYSDKVNYFNSEVEFGIKVREENKRVNEEIKNVDLKIEGFKKEIRLVESNYKRYVSVID